MKIYSIHFNRPDYAKIQHQISQDLGHDLIIVNNGPSADIHDTCLQNKITEIPIKNKGTLSHSHANAINELLKVKSDSEDFGLIDHDVFLFKNVEIDNWDILTLKQSRGSYDYCWPGFLFCSHRVPIKSVNFNPFPPGDTGSKTHCFYSDKDYKISHIKENRIPCTDSSNNLQSNSYSELYLNDELLAIHATNGSGWHSKFSAKKESIIQSLISK